MVNLTHITFVAVVSLTFSNWSLSIKSECGATLRGDNDVDDGTRRWRQNRYVHKLKFNYEFHRYALSAQAFTHALTRAHGKSFRVNSIFANLNLICRSCRFRLCLCMFSIAHRRIGFYFNRNYAFDKFTFGSHRVYSELTVSVCWRSYCSIVGLKDVISSGNHTTMNWCFKWCRNLSHGEFTAGGDNDSTNNKCAAFRKYSDWFGKVASYTRCFQWICNSIGCNLRSNDCRTVFVCVLRICWRTRKTRIKLDGIIAVLCSVKTL